jgi:hypothetical protein
MINRAVGLGPGGGGSKAEPLKALPPACAHNPKVVAAEAGADEADVAARVELLRAVLPDGGLGGAALPGGRAADLVRLAVDVDGVVGRLLALRDALPRANVSAIVARHPALLLLGADELRAGVREVCARGCAAWRSAFCRGCHRCAALDHACTQPHNPHPLQFREELLAQGGTDPDALAEVRISSTPLPAACCAQPAVDMCSAPALHPQEPPHVQPQPRPPPTPQAQPMLLEPGALAAVLQELGRLFGGKPPPGQLLQGAPDLALSCQSLQGQSRGERDFDYLRDIFSGGGGGGGASAELLRRAGGAGGGGSPDGSGGSSSGGSSSSAAPGPPGV